MAAVCHWDVRDDHHSMCHCIWLSLEINWWWDRLVPPMSSKVTASPCYRGSWSWTFPAQGASCPSIHSVQRADMNVQAVLKPVICQQSGWLICQSKWLWWLQKHHDTTWRHEKLWQQGRNDCLITTQLPLYSTSMLLDPESSPGSCFTSSSLMFARLPLKNKGLTNQGFIYKCKMLNSPER